MDPNLNQTSSQISPEPVQTLPNQAAVPIKSSDQTKIIWTIITVFGLLLFYPFGVILMWVLTKWPKWLKLVITLVPIIIIVITLSLVGLTVYKGLLNNARNPQSRSNYPTDNTPIATTSAQLDTSNWKVYQDKINHFSIKYPEDKLEQYTASRSGVVAFYNKSGQISHETPYDVTFSSSNIKISYQKQLYNPDNFEDDIRKRFSETIQLTQFSLNGRPVIKVKPDQLGVPDTGYVTETYEYVQAKDGYLYDITMETKTSDQESQNIFDNMITTLEEL